MLSLYVIIYFKLKSTHLIQLKSSILCIIIKVSNVLKREWESAAAAISHAGECI